MAFLKIQNKIKDKLIHNINDVFTNFQIGVNNSVKKTGNIAMANELSVKLKQTQSYFKASQKSFKNRHFSSKDFLEEFVGYFTKANEELVTVNFNMSEDIKVKQLKPLCGILEQLLNNSIKHGKKDNEILHIDVNLKNINNKIELLYKDNGKGFIGEKPFREGSMGIAIINANAKKIGLVANFWNDIGFNCKIS